MTQKDNKNFSSNDAGKLFVFALLVLPPSIFLVGIVPVLFLLFGSLMFRKSGDFGHIETAARNYKIFCILVSGLLFLPVSALLIYNFVELKSLMSSFYLLVVFSVLMIIINQLTNRIDRLYDIAVGSNEIKEKKGKKICKEK